MKLADTFRSVLIDRLDADILLAFTLKKDRAWLLAHGDMALTAEQEALYKALVKRRKQHEPIAYILGEKEFYGRSFDVDRRVLIPRPSTEALIDEVKFLFGNRFEINGTRMIDADSEIVILTHLFPRKGMCFDTLRRVTLSSPSRSEGISKGRCGATQHDTTIIDVGTGSGCIAITLALEIPNVKIIATDISNEALEVAKMNAEKHGVFDRIEFVEENGIPENRQDDTMKFLLVSNPPYIPEGDPLPPDVSLYEPRGALFAGSDGMDVLTPLIQEAKNDPLCIGFIIEMRQEQAKKLMTIL